MPLVNVSMARGRSPEQQEAMLRASTDVIHDSIRVWVIEFENTDLLAGSNILAEQQARLARESSQLQQEQQQQ